ncbi:hypothetical protein KEM56_007118 [Ascosphaera pollenicola]|nr:hypothetical protein KEM56_007118 [Ascosphaera pollenicola]
MEKEKEKKKGRAKSHGHGHHRKSSEDEESFADEISSSLHGEGVKKRESLVFDRNEIKLDDEDVQINTNGPQTHHSLTGSVSGIGFGKKKNKDKDKDTNTSPGLFYSLFGSGKKKASNGNNTSDASHSSHSLTSFGHKKLGSKSNAPSSPDTSKGHRRGLGSSTAAINNILTKKPTNDTPRTASGTTNPSGASDTVEMYLLRPDIDYPWTRFTLAEEREIYRLAHKKLSSQGRPLLPQVLLSNFMYSYLAKVQAANPHMALPTSAAQNSAMKRSQQEQQEAAMQMQMQEREQQQQQQLAQGYLADTTDGNGGDAYSAQVQAHMAQWAGMDAAKYDELERKELEQWENEQTEQQLSGMGMIEVGPAGMVNEAGQAMTWEDMYAYEDAYYGYGEAEGEGEEDSGAGTSIGHGGQQGQQQQQQQQQQVYVRTSSYG